MEINDTQGRHRETGSLTMSSLEHHFLKTRRLTSDTLIRITSSYHHSISMEPPPQNLLIVASRHSTLIHGPQLKHRALAPHLPPASRTYHAPLLRVKCRSKRTTPYESTHQALRNRPSIIAETCSNGTNQAGQEDRVVELAMHRDWLTHISPAHIETLGCGSRRRAAVMPPQGMPRGKGSEKGSRQRDVAEKA